MINEGDFRTNVIDILKNPDNYTNEQLHEAFLEMAERYFDEMISSLNMERALTKDMSEEEADDMLNEIAMSCPGLNELERTNLDEEDPVQAIINRMDFIECGFGFTLE